MPSRRGEPPAPPVCVPADRAPIGGSRLDALAEILVDALATPPNEASCANPGIAKAGADRRRRGNALPQQQIGQPHGPECIAHQPRLPQQVRKPATAHKARNRPVNDRSTPS
jgi:hypothetical protein